MISNFKVQLILVLSLNFSVLPVAFGSQLEGVSCKDAVSLKGQASPFEISLKVNEATTKDGKPTVQLLNGGTFLSEAVNTLFRWMHKPLKVDEIAVTISRFKKDDRDIPYFIKLLEAARVQVVFDEKMLEQIPKTGPFVLISNHPLFGVDGLAIAAAVSKIRPDIKVVLNKMLQGIPDLSDHAILVNPFGGKSAANYNRTKMLEMNTHVKNGGALLLFPAGAPTQKFKSSDLLATDQEWRKGVIHLMQQGADVPVIPIYTEGQPSDGYLKAKLYAPPAALVIGLREIGRQAESTIRIEIGSPISSRSISDLTSEEKLAYLRGRTYLLSSRMMNEINPAVSVATRTETKLIDGKAKTLIHIPLRGILSQIEADAIFKVHTTLEDLVPLVTSHDRASQEEIKRYISLGAELVGLKSRTQDQIVDVVVSVNSESLK